MDPDEKSQLSDSDLIPSTNTPSPKPIHNKTGKPILIISIIFLLIIFIASAYDLINSSMTNKSPRSIPSQRYVYNPPPSPKVLNTKPKMMAFMRKGEIWLKNFDIDKEQKISKSVPVENPQLSYDGKYLSYFSLIHGGDGFPTSPFYVIDTGGVSEFQLGKGNMASRVHWAKSDDYLGYINFPDYKKTQAILYDAQLGKRILVVNLIDSPKNTQGISVLTSDNSYTDKSYNVTLNCSNLELKYVSFCKEYENILDNNQTYINTVYNRNYYIKSKYTKPNYNLIRSQKLNNGLVVLEYYTGEAQNPESKWGMGSFIPGFDEGVIDTYTVLIDEASGKVIDEVPLAIDTDFIF